MSQRRRIEQASRRFERFHGAPPERVDRREIEVPDTVLQVGTLEGIVYSAQVDGENKSTRFYHPFRRSSRPLLCATPDGKMLVIVGGRFRFTERGIVDT